MPIFLKILAEDVVVWLRTLWPQVDCCLVELDTVKIVRIRILSTQAFGIESRVRTI